MRLYRAEVDLGQPQHPGHPEGVEAPTKMASDESPRGLLFSPPAAQEVPRDFWPIGVFEDRTGLQCSVPKS